MGYSPTLFQANEFDRDQRRCATGVWRWAATPRADVRPSHDESEPTAAHGAAASACPAQAAPRGIPHACRSPRDRLVDAGGA